MALIMDTVGECVNIAHFMMLLINLFCHCNGQIGTEVFSSKMYCHYNKSNKDFKILVKKHQSLYKLDC